ncbi:thioredoxin [Croceivirga radicis]|uniref:Thioredoxin n=2 Tax=Croceivirga radicis TaxID=1929488 RepID=A0A1V6LN90_9FLAO|nr:thioredoxin [Croceivirga radicis]
MRILLTLIVMSFLISCKQEKKQLVKTNVDEPVKEEEFKAFPVYDFQGLKPLLSKNNDTVYIVNFWATWCKPCIAELPDFEKTYAERKEKKVELVLVSLDMPNLWEKRLVPFVKEKNLKGKVVILDDPKMNNWIPQVDENWGGGIPATLIYNRNKRLFFEEGLTYEKLNEALNTF